MVIGSKTRWQSLNLDQFSLNLDSNQIELVNKAKYLGLLVKDDLSWDDHILQLCKSMNHYIHVFRRLNKIFSSYQWVWCGVSWYCQWRQGNHYGKLLMLVLCTTRARSDHCQQFRKMLSLSRYNAGGNWIIVTPEDSWMNYLVRYWNITHREYQFIILSKTHLYHAT